MASNPRRPRDPGEVISERQSRTRWVNRGEGLEIRAPELAWLLAWVDAALSCGDAGHGAGLALFETSWLRVLERAQGRVGLAAAHLTGLDEETRRELLGPDGDDLVLGYTETSGEWVPGWAGLLQVEEEVFRYSLELRSEECRRPDREHRAGMRCLVEVRDMVDRRRGRRGLPLAIETVENRLSSARSKLRRWASEARASAT